MTSPSIYPLNKHITNIKSNTFKPSSHQEPLKNEESISSKLNPITNIKSNTMNHHGREFS